MTQRLIALFCALFGLSTLPAFAQNTALVMDSEPGDYIGGGQNYYYTPANGTFQASRSGNTVHISFAIVPIIGILTLPRRATLH